MNKKATIIDLEIGNIFSLRSALKFCGIDTTISSDINDPPLLEIKLDIVDLPE